MSPSPVSVLLVDDSLIALTILSRMLSTSPDIQVVGKARSGREALELIPRLQPAVICTDLHMPDMDGLELTTRNHGTLPTADPGRQRGGADGGHPQCIQSCWKQAPLIYSPSPAAVWQLMNRTSLRN